jgi:hypothetical protein
VPSYCLRQSARPITATTVRAVLVPACRIEVPRPCGFSHKTSPGECRWQVKRPMRFAGSGHIVLRSAGLPVPISNFCAFANSRARLLPPTQT